MVIGQMQERSKNKECVMMVMVGMVKDRLEVIMGVWEMLMNRMIMGRLMLNRMNQG